MFYVLQSNIPADNFKLLIKLLKKNTKDSYIKINNVKQILEILMHNTIHS
jgi:hypothetical protein